MATMTNNSWTKDGLNDLCAKRNQIINELRECETSERWTLCCKLNELNAMIEAA